MSEGLPEWADDDVGVEERTPPAREDIEAQVRRRRRALVLGAVGVVVAYVVFVGVLSLIWHAWPTVYAWVLLAVVLVLAAGSLWPLRSPAGRAAWDERAARLVRVDAA